MSPAISTGDSARTCLASGAWSGSPLMCTLPNACLTLPCAPSSACVVNNNVANGYSCVCVSGAFGTPGLDGSGCIVPAVVAQNGSLLLKVSDLDDISFKVGQRTSSIGSINSDIISISEPGGLIDTHITTAVTEFETSTNSFIDSANTAIVGNITTMLVTSAEDSLATNLETTESTFASSLSSAIASLSTQTSAAVSATGLSSSTSMSTAAASARSQAIASDSTTLASIYSSVESMRVSISTIVAGKQPIG